MPAGTQTASATRRGSPDVVSKRKAARAFNELLGGVSASSKLDGRTQKRRQRILDELKEGKARSSKKGLKPLEVLTRIDTLIKMGESLAAIKKVCRPARPVLASAEVIAGVSKLHAAYRFPPEIYAFVGIDLATLKQAGILGRPAVRKGSALAAGSAANRPARAA